MFKISELCNKDIISEKDGKKLGRALDIDIDTAGGTLRSLIIPAENHFMGIFGHGEDTVIPWENIRRIGIDVVLLGEASPGDTQKEKAVSVSPENGPFNWDDWEL